MVLGLSNIDDEEELTLSSTPNATITDGAEDGTISVTFPTAAWNSAIDWSVTAFHIPLNSSAYDQPQANEGSGSAPCEFYKVKLSK